MYTMCKSSRRIVNEERSEAEFMSLKEWRYTIPVLVCKSWHNLTLSTFDIRTQPQHHHEHPQSSHH